MCESGIRNDIFNVCGDGSEILQGMLNIDDVKWDDDLPIVVYDINIDKVSKLYNIPNTKEVVSNFIEDGV